MVVVGGSVQPASGGGIVVLTQQQGGDGEIVHWIETGAQRGKSLAVPAEINLSQSGVDAFQAAGTGEVQQRPAG
ncbi:hypothetical protein SEEM842_19172 [Salmonella enterica subsp. enterica serovar Senftenberg str. 423984-2]|nr:hypothetical protein SEEM038_19201 [Salmonella enterica subsp. enterica serovar Senftenberg str. NC_MB012510-0038]ESG31957.1 hypothetical protein SEEM842_19172 [Salmonella enterica subsp. enterica serovar Senftenberg str. 423984-2]